MRQRLIAFLFTLGLAAGTFRALADEPSSVPTFNETIEVTATRTPEHPIEIPASIQVISGEELERRQVSTLDQALALVLGVSVAPGGDGGPASSVPEMMGLREFDAFLLVVDDVPWGGAFNPALATLDLTNVERIEVLRGSAPVLYGATSFIGVIHVVHRAPDATYGEIQVAAGSWDTLGAHGTVSLPTARAWHQSLSAGYDTIGFRDERTEVGRGHMLYRGGGEFGWGRVRLDFDMTLLTQNPASPHPREGAALTTLVPVDANHNPSDARQDEDRFHLVFGHSTPAFSGEWSTTVAVTYASRHNVKGFLRDPFTDGIADGFRQAQDETDVYFDTHLAHHPTKSLALVYGLDELYGDGSMESENFEYDVSLDGSDAPDSSGITIDERPKLSDTRSFAGLYGQAIWTPGTRWRLELGARVNYTRERRTGEVLAGDGGGGASPAVTDTLGVTRGGGSVGVSFRAWGEGPDSLWLFADYRNTFKPAAIDFGPEAEGEILDPEDAEMYEGGVKGSHAGGRIGWELSGFHMNFDNVVVATSVNGLPALENVGSETFDGIETQAWWSPAPDLRLQATYAYHDAKFDDYLATFDGGVTVQQLHGNRIEMSANDLASFGIVYLPAKGFSANAIVNYVGDRFLNKRNTAPADAYTTWSAGLGYRFGTAEVRVNGVNLNNARDPVAESELGDGQYYLLPARTVTGTLLWHF